MTTPRYRPSLRPLLAAGLCAFAAIAGSASAQSPSPPTTPAPADRAPADRAPADSLASSRDVSSLLAPICEKNKAPGLAAILIEGDTIRLHAATGIRTRGSDAPITIHDLFHLGSCTKAMTATLCAILVEEGTLRWDTTIADVFPAELAAEGVDPAWKDVTLLELLTHHTGIPTDLSAKGLWPRLTRINDPLEGRRTLLLGVLKDPPKSPPGTTFEYSNANTAIAGHMAEVKLGVPWEDLMRRRVFEPLGITTAGFGAPGRADVVDQPRGHTAVGIAIVPGPRADNPPAIAPAGTVHMSLPDWAKFAAFHLRGSRPAPENAPAVKPLLSAESFKVLHTPFQLRPNPNANPNANSNANPNPTPNAARPSTYACGWGVLDRAWAKGRVLTHAGSNTMWYSVIWIAPERNIAILAACNQGGSVGTKATDDAVAALLAEWQNSAPTD